MLTKFMKSMGLALGGLATVFLITYILLVMFFTDRFNTHTYINGIDATGMSISEVSEKLAAEEYSDYSMSITDYYGNEYTVAASDVGFVPNYNKSLSDIMVSQNQFTWFFNVVYPTQYSIEPDSFYFDSAKLDAFVSELEPFEDYDNSKADVYIKKELGKYFLVDDTKQVFDKNKAKALISTSLINGVKTLSLNDCYSPVKYTAEQKKYVDLFAAIDEYQNCELMYVDEDVSRHVDFTETNKWLELDDNMLPYVKDGKLAISKDRISEFVESLSETFDTSDNMVEWTRKDGTVVELQYRGEGFKVDGAGELIALEDALYAGESFERKPIYSQEGLGRGNNIVGDSYVEVDFEHQKMYCYVKGELKLESDIVSGNLRYHYDTPSMITDIYFMQEGRTLRGENYATFVYYWMAFYNHYGLHDATWRREFGGDIYKTNGSHGCVNLPKDVAGQLYELAYVGMPVVLYYGENQEHVR